MTVPLRHPIVNLETSAQVGRVGAYGGPVVQFLFADFRL